MVSFAKTGEQGRVIAVAEKQRISDLASTGVYYFSDAKVFQKEAEQLIADKETTKGEYYVMPLYNRYLLKGKACWRICLWPLRCGIRDTMQKISVCRK